MSLWKDNIQNFIGECLNSILSQTYKNFEVILVDNGSMESETFEMISYFEEKYDNFKCIRLECEFNYSYI